MTVNGKMIKEKAKVYIIIIENLLLEINMSDIGKIIKEKEKRFIILIMGIDMKEIGKMIK